MTTAQTGPTQAQVPNCLLGSAGSARLGTPAHAARGVLDPVFAQASLPSFRMRCHPVALAEPWLAAFRDSAAQCLVPPEPLLLLITSSGLASMRPE